MIHPSVTFTIFWLTRTAHFNYIKYPSHTPLNKRVQKLKSACFSDFNAQKSWETYAQFSNCSLGTVSSHFEQVQTKSSNHKVNAKKCIKEYNEGAFSSFHMLLMKLPTMTSNGHDWIFAKFPLKINHILWGPDRILTHISYLDQSIPNTQV